MKRYERITIILAFAFGLFGWFLSSTLDMVKRYLSLAQVDVDRAHKRASPVDNWVL